MSENLEDPTPWTLTVKTTVGYSNKLAKIARREKLLDTKRGPNRSEAARVAIDHFLGGAASDDTKTIRLKAERYGIANIYYAPEELQCTLHDAMKNSANLTIACTHLDFISTHNEPHKLIRGRIAAGKPTRIIVHSPSLYKKETKHHFETATFGNMFGSCVADMTSGMLDKILNSLAEEKPLLEIIGTTTSPEVTLTITDTKCWASLHNFSFFFLPSQNHRMTLEVDKIQSAESLYAAFVGYAEHLLLLASKLPNKDVLAPYIHLKKRPRASGAPPRSRVRVAKKSR